jgi:hypothetical protein
MKVLALIESPDHVCYRYRVEAFAWALAERGLLLESAPLNRGTLARLARFRDAGQADVVILQRKLLPLWQLQLLRRAARRLIYDVDDSLFQRDSYNEKGPDSWVRLSHFWATLYASDAVTVGNDYLNRRAGAYIDSSRVHVMPTCVETEKYPTAEHRRRRGDARLVWIGQRSTLPSIRCASAQLQAAAARLPGLSLRVICDRYPEVPGLKTVPRPWCSATETSELIQGDIGINWLPNDTWSLGKCGLKVLQYMAAGLPVVANPVGMNREMVVHGETGFLAESPSQWAEAIERLACEPALRAQMGRRGRQLVEERFSVRNWAPRFAQLIEGIAAGRFCATRPAESKTAPQPLAPRPRQPARQIVA